MPPRGRKSAELLINDPKGDNCVQKSKPLFSLWKSPLVLSEFKILDIYLSRINSHNPEQRDVILEKGEIENILGISRIRVEELDKRLKHLSETSVDISYHGEVDRIVLFERVKAHQDENGLWQVTLTCTQSAMKYIFNVEKLGYLRYAIKSITQINSIYSYILFTYIELNSYKVSWTVELSELKEILNCTDESYNEFKIFNNRILKRCQAEIQSKTETRFEYEPVRKGRRVAGIRFTVPVQSQKGLITEQVSEQNTLPSTDDSQSNSVDDNITECDPIKLAELLSVCNFEFDKEQTEMLYCLLKNKGIDDEQMATVLRKQYLKMNCAEKKDNHIKNKFKYLCKMLENETATPKSTKTDDKSSNKKSSSIPIDDLKEKIMNKYK